MTILTLLFLVLFWFIVIMFITKFKYITVVNGLTLNLIKGDIMTSILIVAIFFYGLLFSVFMRF